MEKIAEELRELMTGRSLTLSVAESITGGLISKVITDVPGSSDYFKGAIVAYSVESKIRIPGIDSGIIESNGTVSEITAIMLAKNVRKIFQTSIGLGITGVAGPKLVEEKEIGLVYGAISFDRNYFFKWNFSGDRENIRKKACLSILNELLEILRRKE